MGIGKRIKEAREIRGLTQKQLSEIIGVTPSAVTNYENDTSHPKTDILLKIFSALDVDANYLFQDSINKKEPAINDGKPLSKTRSDLIEFIHGADEQTIELMNSIAQKFQDKGNG